MNSPSQLTFQIKAEDADVRLDRYLAANLPDYSRSFLQRLIKRGLVKCNGHTCRLAKTRLRGGDQVKVNIVEEEEPDPRPENISLPIIYEDRDLLVINKPPGMVVHPAAGNTSGTIVNALLGRYHDFAAPWQDEAESARRPGIVHRLDKDTSGCLIVAKNASVRFKLAAAFAARRVGKTYAAVVLGHPREKRGEIVTLIGRHPVNRKKMAVLKERGREAITRYELLKKAELNGMPISLLKVRILTGRTHQIRVHMAHLQTPVLGDKVYGGRRQPCVPRQMLHAWQLQLRHPITGRDMTFTSPVPADFPVTI